MSTKVKYVWEIRFPGRDGWPGRWHVLADRESPATGRFDTPEGAQRNMDIWKRQIRDGWVEHWPVGTEPGSPVCEARLVVVTTIREVYVS